MPKGVWIHFLIKPLSPVLNDRLLWKLKRGSTVVCSMAWDSVQRKNTSPDVHALHCSQDHLPHLLKLCYEYALWSSFTAYQELLNANKIIMKKSIQFLRTYSYRMFPSNTYLVVNIVDRLFLRYICQFV